MKNSTATLKNEIDQIPFEKKSISLFCIFQNSDTKKKKMQYKRANLQRAYDATKMAFQSIDQQDCFQCPNPHFVIEPGGSR